MSCCNLLAESEEEGSRSSEEESEEQEEDSQDEGGPTTSSTANQIARDHALAEELAGLSRRRVVKGNTATLKALQQLQQARSRKPPSGLPPRPAAGASSGGGGAGEDGGGKTTKGPGATSNGAVRRVAAAGSHGEQLHPTPYPSPGSCSMHDVSSPAALLGSVVRVYCTSHLTEQQWGAVWLTKHHFWYGGASNRLSACMCVWHNTAKFASAQYRTLDPWLPPACRFCAIAASQAAQ